MNQVVGFEISNLSDLISKASVIERTLRSMQSTSTRGRETHHKETNLTDTRTTLIREEMISVRVVILYLNNLITSKETDNAQHARSVGRCTWGTVCSDRQSATNAGNQATYSETARYPPPTNQAKADLMGNEAPHQLEFML
ncbi:hypothetical protein SLA2020_449170 [Shorea laevis]